YIVVASDGISSRLVHGTVVVPAAALDGDVVGVRVPIILIDVKFHGQTVVDAGVAHGSCLVLRTAGAQGRETSAARTLGTVGRIGILNDESYPSALVGARGGIVSLELEPGSKAAGKILIEVKVHRRSFWVVRSPVRQAQHAVPLVGDQVRAVLIRLTGI